MTIPQRRQASRRRITGGPTPNKPTQPDHGNPHPHDITTAPRRPPHIDPGTSDPGTSTVSGQSCSEPLLYTATQAAVILQVRPSWIRRKAAARTIPCRYLGKHLRFTREDLITITTLAAPVSPSAAHPAMPAQHRPPRPSPHHPHHP
jgi:Helix-turn-helix domain